MAWSPYKDRVIGFVERNPGCSKWDVACFVTRSCLRNPRKQYYIVNTAIRNGWIEAEMRGGRYYLFTPDSVEFAYVDGTSRANKNGNKSDLAQPQL
jgi:hypothetical protein